MGIAIAASARRHCEERQRRSNPVCSRSGSLRFARDDEQKSLTPRSPLPRTHAGR